MTEANTSTCKICLDCKIEQLTSNFNRDKPRIDGLSPYCKTCVKVRAKATYLKHRDKHIAARRKDYQKNKERYKQKALEWGRANPEKRKLSQQKYDAADPVRKHEKNKAHRLANPGMYAAHYKMRQQKLKRALSPWADLKAIESFYIESARLTKETGIKHHVDHFYPLTSDIVCGLHNQFNLRVIPARENLSKANSFPT